MSLTATKTMKVPEDFYRWVKSEAKSHGTTGHALFMALKRGYRRYGWSERRRLVKQSERKFPVGNLCRGRGNAGRTMVGATRPARPPGRD